MKRLFDSICVLPALPMLVLVFAVVGLAIRLTSRGPVLFLQKRMGRHRRTFTILKFRTMEQSENCRHNCVTTSENQRFTPIGPFLRRWKLDELPQLLNVLMGDMSLVGSRPKLPEHQLGDLLCRPGITGAATLAFAREEQVLAFLPSRDLNDFYLTVVLPAKRRLDLEYMTSATLFSDFKLIVDTVFRRWDTSAMEKLLNLDTFKPACKTHGSEAPSAPASRTDAPSIAHGELFASAD
jgi:lipopolysaccharide/colanic/teichoic acid biosynthesis glycosyltransferase